MKSSNYQYNEDVKLDLIDPQQYKDNPDRLSEEMDGEAIDIDELYNPKK